MPVLGALASSFDEASSNSFPAGQVNRQSSLNARHAREDEVLVLVLNAGSSSLKYGLFGVSSLTTASQVASGIAERIGQPMGAIKHTAGRGDEAKEVQIELVLDNHEVALQKVLEMLTDPKTGVVQDPADIKCVGHRVVHGGTIKTAALIDKDVEAAIKDACTLAPLHNPPNLMGINTARSIFKVPQVAVFDTAFHMTIPPEAYSYAVPKDLAEKHGIRRYGFHGTSYSYACKRAAVMLGRRLSTLNIIACHLGSGTSMACIKAGQCIDTTMGMTPLEGLVMATRSGDIDAGVILHLAKEENLDLSQFSDLLNKQSGLKGMCGFNDMRSINLAISQGDQSAKLARAVFIARIRKYLGSYLVQLGGHVDALVFTGGIGENDIQTRKEVCSELTFFGIEVDHERNASASDISKRAGTAMISSAFSRVSIMVVRADEEGEIALQSVATAGLIKDEQHSTGMEIRTGPATGGVGRVYLAALEDGCGATTAAIGIVGVLLGAGKLDPKWICPFFPFEDDSSPFVNKDKDHGDPVISVMVGMMHAESIPKEDMVGIQMSKALAMISEGRETEIMDTIIGRYQALSARGMDFILIMGHPNMGMTWHRNIASALGLPIVVVGALDDKVKGSQATEAVMKLLSPVQNSSRGAGQVNGVIINRLPLDADRSSIKDALKKHSYKPLGLIPMSRIMAEISATEVAASLSATVKYGHSAMERVPMRSMLVATLHIEGLLDKIRERGPGCFLVVHTGRGDVVLGVMTAIQARGFPAVSGILMTGGGRMDPGVESVMDSLEALDAVPVPVMFVNDDTFVAAHNIVNMRRKLAASGTRKVDSAISLYEKYAERESIYSLVTLSKESKAMPVTPQLFEFQLKATARAARQRIVLPEGNDARVINAASELLQRGLCKVTILGNQDEVMKLAQRLQADISKATVIDPSCYGGIEGMAEELYERRKAKGMTMESARRELRNNLNMFGTMMMALGMADGMVSGACHTTADTMRPALQILKTAPGVTWVSSIFFMLLEGGVKVFGDCAIVENPTTEQLASIAQASAKTAKSFGIEPRVAMLSYATGDSNTGPMITKVREATSIVKKEYPEIAELVDGPIQFDAAVDPEVAAVKYKGNPGPVAGRANVCIFPDLNAGNNAYKAVQQASGCVAIGPVMQGLRMPVNDLSRGCTVEDIIQTVVVTCVQSISTMDPEQLAKTLSHGGLGSRRGSMSFDQGPDPLVPVKQSNLGRNPGRVSSDAEP